MFLHFHVDNLDFVILTFDILTYVCTLCNKFDKNVLGYISGDFFTSTSVTLLETHNKITFGVMYSETQCTKSSTFVDLRNSLESASHVMYVKIV
jgi:hypothetical protein